MAGTPSKILHCVTGSVAAYKAMDIIRGLRELGLQVTPVMTEASRNFVTPLSLEVASGSRAYSGLFDDPMAHISLARDADLLLVAPATANSIGKFANGIADDLPSTLYLSYRGRVLLAPAMNWRMYENPVLRRNLDYLKSQGATEIPPESGPLACGERGTGRMADAETIVEAVRTALSEKDLSGERVVVTAGPTREHIDTVRFISNRSTGKMGYALARAALRRGAEVALITGPSSLMPPLGADVVSVDTAVRMRDAVLKAFGDCTVLIMAAAVTDFSPGEKFLTKVEKSSIDSIRLEKTPDILAEVGGLRSKANMKKPLIVGFAAEAGDRVERAREKLVRKGADIIVFNNIDSPGSGFEADTNRVVIVGKDGNEELPLLTKEEAAGAILDRVVGLLRGPRRQNKSS